MIEEVDVSGDGRIDFNGNYLTQDKNRKFKIVCL